MRTIRSMIFKYLVSLVLAVFLSFSIFSYLYFKSSMEKTVLDDHRRALDSIVSNIDSNIRAQLQEIDALAKLISPLPREVAIEKLRDYLAIGSMFGTIHWYETRGPLLVHLRSSGLSEYQPASDFRKHSSIEFTALTLQVIKEKQPQFSKPFYSRRSGSYFQVYILPVFKPGTDHVQSVLSAAIFPQFHGFDELVNGLALSRANFIATQDSHQNLVVVNGIEREKLENAALDRTELFVDQTEYKLVQQSLESVPMTVTLGVNSSLIREKIANLRKYMLILGTVGVIMAALLSLLMAKRIATPFQLMAKGIAAVNAGVFSEKITAKTRSEIDQVYESINEISEKVEKARYLGVIWSQDTGPEIDLENPQ